MASDIDLDDPGVRRGGEAPLAWSPLLCGAVLVRPANSAPPPAEQSAKVEANDPELEEAQFSIAAGLPSGRWQEYTS